MGQANGKEKADGGAQTVDGGALMPHGVYTGVQDYNHNVVKALIQDRKLAAFYPGLDDEEAYAQAPYNTECPICFLHYPSPLNRTRCCGQPICTECFVQIKRADPTSHNPPSSEPAMCPYCQETNFGIVYTPPPPGVLSGEIKNAAGVAESASAARQQAEGSAEGSLQQQQAAKRRKSFSAADPGVVTTDTIRPDWQAKLMAAEAATMRRANRRIIMRQVGDRLIPIGVSSSRLGADLPPGSTTGPGGAIIIGEHARWGTAPAGVTLPVLGDRRGSRGRRGGELAQFLQSLGGGPDMEEMMMMEAMRLSLLEHEEQQRRETQGQSTALTADSAAPLGQVDQPESAPAALATGGGSMTSAQQQTPLPRSSSLANDTPSVPTTSTAMTSAVPAPSSQPYTLTPQQLGISNSMMAELSELVEGGLPLSDPPASADPSGSGNAVPMSISAASVSAPAATTSFHPSSPSAVRQPISSTHSPSQTPPVGSPSRIGSNPNNPFRRMNGSNANSPTHSRQGSVANVGVAGTRSTLSNDNGAPPS